MATWKRFDSYENTLLVSSVKPDKRGRKVKIKVNSSEIILSDYDVKQLVIYLIGSHLF